MAWVMLFHTDQVVVEVDLPVTAPKDKLREAALQALDRGEYTWETIDGGMEVSDDYIPYDFEASDARRKSPVCREMR